MYHTIVKSIARNNFELVNTQRYDELIASCSPTIRHRFGGHHALGGVRNDSQTLRVWFERLGRLAPGLRLQVEDIWVKGFPWHTTAIIRWTATMPDTKSHHFRFEDGTQYANHGVHIVILRWGKAISIDANEDSQMVDRYLKERFRQGVEEAGAEMIES